MTLAERIKLAGLSESDFKPIGNPTEEAIIELAEMLASQEEAIMELAELIGGIKNG